MDAALAKAPKPILPPSFFVGIDLGQSADPSALAVVERSLWPDPKRPARFAWHFACRHLLRWELGTPYPVMVDDVEMLLRTPPLVGCTLAVDRTGVGAVVVDLFAARGMPCNLCPILITSGHTVTWAADGVHVPKKELASAMQAVLQTRRFQVARSLPFADKLAQELQTFSVKITAAGNETFEAWREKDHDDLVLAAAMPVWLGENEPAAFAEAPVPGGAMPSWRAELYGGLAGRFSP